MTFYSEEKGMISMKAKQTDQQSHIQLPYFRLNLTQNIRK